MTTWNDRAIAKLNPGVKLPSLRVAPIYRSDSSGDTYAFTDYLSHVSRAWRAAIVDPPASARDAYPLSTFTYALVPKGSSKRAALKRFLTYAVTKGQSFATKLSFAPLPPSVQRADRKAIASF